MYYIEAMKLLLFRKSADDLLWRARQAWIQEKIDDRNATDRYYKQGLKSLQKVAKKILGSTGEPDFTEQKPTIIVDGLRFQSHWLNDTDLVLLCQCERCGPEPRSVWIKTLVQLGGHFEENQESNRLLHKRRG